MKLLFTTLKAEYAHKLKKKMIFLLLEEGYKPSGWLGLLQGLEHDYQLNSDDQLNLNFAKLTKVIDDWMSSKQHEEDAVECE